MDDLRGQLNLMRSDRKSAHNPLQSLSNINTPIITTGTREGRNRHTRGGGGGIMSVESKLNNEDVAIHLDFGGGKSARKGTTSHTSEGDSNELADISLVDGDEYDDDLDPGRYDDQTGTMTMKGVNRDRKSFIQEMLPSGELSYAAQTRYDQQLQLREAELNDLLVRSRQLEISREALLKEVTFLSSKNTQLEETLMKDGDLRERYTKLNHQLEVLLVMVGEKEEEIVAMREEMKEMQALYKNQIATLVEQVVGIGRNGIDGLDKEGAAPADNNEKE